MRTAKIMLFILCCAVCVSSVQAATLKDKNPSIFYQPGHYLEGLPITVGPDIYGYNYQAHKFNGFFANVYLGGDGYPPYRGDTAAYYQALVNEGLAATLEEAETLMSAWWYWPDRDIRLVMKWNDAWLSNQDRGDNSGGTVPDGKLDRHYGYPAYTGSGAWNTNHETGTYEIVRKGKIKRAHWTFFVKTVTPPSTAFKLDGIWYTEDGIEIGPVIFGAFADVQIIYNDPFGGAHGKQYGSPFGPGFGLYGPE